MGEATHADAVRQADAPRQAQPSQQALLQLKSTRYHLCMSLLALSLVLGAVRGEEPCPRQNLLRVRPSDLGVTHSTLLGHVRNEETRRLENVVIHCFIKIAKMVSGSTHMYGIGWVEGFDAGLAIEFMPEHLPYLRHLPPFELWAIDSVGNDIEGPVPVNITHGSVIDTLRMGFRMEAVFRSQHELFQLRVMDWTRRYALHTRNVALPGTLQPWYRFPHAPKPQPAVPSSISSTSAAGTASNSELTLGWTPVYDMMLHAVAELPGPNYAQAVGGSTDVSLNRAMDLMDMTTDDDVATGTDAGQGSSGGEQPGRMDAFWATSQRQLKQLDHLEAGGVAAAGDTGVQRPRQLHTRSARVTAGGALRRGVVHRGTSQGSDDDREAEEGDEDEELPLHLRQRASVRLPPRTAPAVASHVPLVVVMTLAFSPSTTPEAHVHYAQQFVRHAEYHLDVLSMQRVVVYIHEGLFYAPQFNNYVSRHLPPHLVPYVTFVVWNEFFMIKNPWYDQYVKYFHSVVALWGYGGALGALIDIDEYIAFPAPQSTLHEALARCNATNLDWVRLTNQMIICDTCHQTYNALWKRSPTGGGDTDLRLWWDARDPAVHRGSRADPGHAQQTGCRWWSKDPLLRYTRVWNDRWFVQVGKVPPEKIGTVEAHAEFQGKHLIRGEAAVAFMHHRGELLPGRQEAWLDPTSCPYIAHLVHSNGFRPKRWGAKLSYFVHPVRDSNWFLVADGS